MGKRRTQAANSSAKRARVEQSEERSESFEPAASTSEPVHDNVEDIITIRDRESRNSETSTAVEQLTNAMRDVFANLTLGNQRPTTSTGFKGAAVPYFDPEDTKQDVEMWCHKIDQLRDVFRWTEDAAIYHALSRLRGLAETWYRSLKDVKYSWEEWKEKLKRAFPSKRDYAEKLDEMMRRRKGFGESYTRYYFEKLSLINICGNITGREAVSCIIHGLHDDHIKSAARAGNYSEPDELFTYLRTLNNVSSTHRSRDSSWQRNARQMPKEKSQSKETAQTSRSGNMNCFKCGKSGHKAYQCKAILDRVCTFCNKRGHDESRCFKKGGKSSTNAIMTTTA